MSAIPVDLGPGSVSSKVRTRNCGVGYLKTHACRQNHYDAAKKKTNLHPLRDLRVFVVRTAVVLASPLT